MNISKIEGRSDLERRGSSIVNTNKDGFLSFLAAREKASTDAERIYTLEDQVKILMDQVKTLMSQGKQL